MLKNRRWLLALLLVVPLIAGACGGGDDTDTDTGSDSTETTKKDTGPPEFEAGTTMERLQTAGKMKVGVKFDQPGFGQKDPTTNKVQGFDVEIAKLIAAGIYGGEAADVESKIEFVEAVSKNREPFITDGTVDIVIATYTINDARKAIVSFAGPYFVAQQDILVKTDNTTIKSVTDLNGKKVCTAKGSTSEKNLRAKAPQAEVVLYDTYSLCAQDLTNGRVEAVTTDNTILAGLASASSGQFKLVEKPFSDEPYGIGLKKDDAAFRNFINDRLEEIYEDGSWADAFETTLGKIGLKTPEPPEIDRYSAAGAGATTTTGAGGAGGSSTTAGSGASTSTTKP